MVTNRNTNLYEGAAGERILGSGDAMTTDTVFAMFSTTKPITGTAVLQCVEDGKLDLDASAQQRGQGQLRAGRHTGVSGSSTIMS
jgi:methyl acetate hydrolase